jgi:hypothetical protein
MVVAVRDRGVLILRDDDVGLVDVAIQRKKAFSDEERRMKR